MNSGYHRSRFLICMLSLLFLLPAACPAAAAAEVASPEVLSAWNTAFETGNGLLEKADLPSLIIPTDYTGFSIGFPDGLENPLLIAGEPVRTDESGVRYYALTEEQAKQIFILPREVSSADGSAQRYYSGEGDHHPSLYAMSPDRSVLFWDGWLPEDNDGHFYRAFFLQRRCEIQVMNGGDAPAHPSERGGIPYALLDFLNQYGASARAEWSPDGRYLFYDLDAYGSLVRLSLPWLFDTQAGEVLPLFTQDGLDQRLPTVTDPDCRFCTILDGCFSRDGQYFYMILFGNLPEWGGENCKILMRWDLRAGTAEPCLRLDDTAASFYETGENRLMVFSPGNKAWIVHTETSACTAEEITWPDIPFLHLTVRNELSGPPVAFSAFFGSGNITYGILSVLRNLPEGENSWYLIPNAPVADSFVSMTPDELQAFADAEREAARAGSKTSTESSSAYCIIDSFTPVSGTPYAVITYSGLSQGKESWTTFWDRDDRTMLLNTETMEMKPIRISDSEAAGSGLSASDPFLAIGDTLYRLVPDAPAETSSANEDPYAAEKHAQWESYVRHDISELHVRYNYSAAFDTEYEVRLLSGDDYKYECHLPETGELVCTNQSYQSSGLIAASDIQVLNNGFRITVDLMTEIHPDLDPETIVHPALQGGRYEAVRVYRAPLALTQERYDMLLERLSRSDSMKLKKMYTKIVPEKLDAAGNRDELIAKYPSVKEQTLYVLTEDAPRQLEKIELLLSDAGYTREDYDLDMQLVSPEYRNADITYPLSYVFRSDTPVRWTCGPTGALLTLCDRLAGTVFRQYVSADPKPDSVGNLPLDGLYTLGGISFRVAADSAQEEPGRLTLVFTAVPEDEWGFFPAE